MLSRKNPDGAAWDDAANVVLDPIGGALVVTLDAQLGGFVTDPWGARRAGLSAVTRVKRSDFGIVWNQVLEAGGVAVSDDVDIEIDIEAIAPSSE